MFRAVAIFNDLLLQGCEGAYQRQIMHATNCTPRPHIDTVLEDCAKRIRNDRVVVNITVN